MNKNLNEEESAQYLKVATKGNMDDMFDFAYTLGQKHRTEFVLQGVTKFAKENGFN